MAKTAHAPAEQDADISVSPEPVVESVDPELKDSHAEATVPLNIANLAPMGTETVEAFTARLLQHASFDGVLEWVTCDLPGYLGVRIAYNVDNAFAVTNLFLTRPPGVGLEDTFRLWSLFIRKVEGLPGGMKSPDPDQPKSYEALLLQYRSLLEWIRGTGYERAKVQRWGN